MKRPNKLTNTYHDEVNKKNIIRLRELQQTLPSFCSQYFRGIQEYTSSRTRVAYAYDIRVFFEYLHDSNPIFKKSQLRNIILKSSTKLQESILKNIWNTVPIIQKTVKNI